MSPEQTSNPISPTPEAPRPRGRLKIFLGYAAGVGKTYAMLEAAHQRQAEGWDVLVGTVDTHQRAETEHLLAGLALLPPMTAWKHGVPSSEMDLAGILQRRPRLVLVDELAHSNAAPALHPRRYQDVLDILSAGCDVYTTMNVQHLESLNDVVSQITGMVVYDTVPDSLIDSADEIELVDLPPDELLNRLADGKVYVPEQAARTLRKFFRKGNLTALRELTLRRAAERVDDQMRSYMQTRAIHGPWPAAERLLVCISLNPQAERLIRTTRRLADELNAEWLAVYVDTPANVRQPLEQRERLQDVLTLAEQLGAQVVKVTADRPADAILQVAGQHNVTKIVIGRPPGPRWKEALQRSIVDELIARSGNLDVYVVGGDSAVPPRLPTPRAERNLRNGLRYPLALLLVGLAALLSTTLHAYFSATNLVMIFILAVLIAAVNLGRGPALLTSITGILVFDFFFVPPYFTLNVADTEYLLTFLVMFAVNMVISQLAVRTREQATAAEQRESETAILYSLSRNLAVTEGLENILKVVVQDVGQTFGREVLIFLPAAASNELLPYGAAGPIDEREFSAAAWVLEHGKLAGRGTDTLPDLSASYMPLKTVHGVIGVLRVKPLGAAVESARLSPEYTRLLEIFSNQAALAIERAQLEEQARHAQLLQATEQLQSALLNSISHDLRTPLVSITGVLSDLDEESLTNIDPARRQMIHTARSDAERLNRLVGNLLDMSRLEAGAMRILKEPNDMQDAIGVALDELDKRLADRPVTVQVQPGLPLVEMDFVLIVHVLVNLIDNAHKYSPPGAPLEIRAEQRGAEVVVQVLDRGAGIAPEDLEHVFEKFFRGRVPESVSGTGLGLSICRGIVEAHGGRIWAEARPDGGSLLSFCLPLGAPGLAEGETP